MMQRSIVGVALATLGLIALSQSASAYTILPPHSTVAGQSTADWTAAWWTWALQAPASENPISDTTGAFANGNNNGPVFFIAGTDGGAPIARTFTVPAGKPLLVPILNFVDLEPAELDPPPITVGERENAANVVVASWQKSVDPSSLLALIDGNLVDNPVQYLEVAGLFSMGAVQAGSVIESFGLPAGADLYPNNAAGYWLMIESLAPGPHTLHLEGVSSAFTPDANCCTNFEIPGFSPNLTLNIAVVPEPASAVLMLVGFVGVIGLRLVGGALGAPRTRTGWPPHLAPALGLDGRARVPPGRPPVR